MVKKQEQSPDSTHSWYARFAKWASMVLGHAWAFSISIGILIIWVIVGIVADFQEPWNEGMQLVSGVINVLLLLLIQNTQNRNNDAQQVKLDELIRILGAERTVLDIEELDEEEVEQYKKQYENMAESERGSAGSDNKPASRTRRKRSSGS
jgi:low affinity Fe/Cu permease